MTRQNTSILKMHYLKDKKKLLMGRLALKERKIFFEYDNEFLKTRLELSPFKLHLQTGVIACKDPVFDGLFGIFNDSLPDGWGRLLLDRKLMTLGISPGNLSPLTRLQYVGNSGMGALVYEPEAECINMTLHEDLDKIANEILLFQENDDDSFVDELLVMNSSSCRSSS